MGPTRVAEAPIEAIDHERVGVDGDHAASTRLKGEVGEVSGLVLTDVEHLGRWEPRADYVINDLFFACRSWCLQRLSRYSRTTPTSEDPSADSRPAAAGSPTGPRAPSDRSRLLGPPHPDRLPGPEEPAPARRAWARTWSPRPVESASTPDHGRGVRRRHAVERAANQRSGRGRPPGPAPRGGRGTGGRTVGSRARVRPGRRCSNDPCR